MRDNNWHFRNFYWISVLFIVIVVIGFWKCCDQTVPECPETICFPGERAWALGKSNNPNVLPNGGELILSKAVSGDGWRAFIWRSGDAHPRFACEDTDGVSAGKFYCFDNVGTSNEIELSVEEVDSATCADECCITYELCLGLGCKDASGGERGSDGGGNSGHD